MSAATLPQLPPIERAWTDLEQMVRGICRKFWYKKTRQEFQDLYDEAKLAFTEAYRSFDPAKSGKLSTWVWHSVNNKLKQRRKKEAKYGCGLLHETEEQPLDQHIVAVRRTVHSIVQEVNKDAGDVIRLLIDFPGEEVATPYELRKRLTAALLDLGWAGARIAEAFAEIRDALR